MFWAGAASLHLIHNFGKEKDDLRHWVVEILVAGAFATGFGWHLGKLVTLKRMEKRGKSESSFTQEFRTF